MDALKGLASKLGNKDNKQGGSSSEDKGDYVDQGVGMVGKQFGQNFDRDQEEKYSDYVRKGYHSATGKDIPVEDKNPTGAGASADKPAQ